MTAQSHIRAALAVLRTRMTSAAIAKRLGVSVPTLVAYSTDPASKSHRVIPQQRLTKLLAMAAREMRRAADELIAAAPANVIALSPYRVTGPALISFSGGRTSAFMLHEILRVHGGRLPDDIYVVFANTGKEREETLDFVRECSVRWNVRIHWVERDDGEPGFREMDFETASRHGEPFQRIIDRKRRLPNWQQRWCTAMLKVEPLQAFMASRGFPTGSYTDIIGLRHDEGHRILKGLAGAEEKGRRIAYPLSKDKVVKADVDAFWRGQLFDLRIEGWQGNCDLCFLKGKGIKKRIIEENPEIAAWWSANETAEKGPGLRGWWTSRHNVASLVAEVDAGQVEAVTAAEEYDVECGLTCAPDVEDMDQEAA